MHLPLSDAERRRLVLRDAFAWVVVAILHLIFFLALVISMQQRPDRIGAHRTAIETILDLTALNRTEAERLEDLRRQESKEPDLSAKPLTVIPQPPVIPEQKAAAPTPGDVLKSIGEALACGASNFEYLNKAQQARCPHQPWMDAKRPDGTIVLAAPPKLAIPQLHMTGAEAVGKQMRQNSGCPIMVNTPCLEDMFTGNNSATPGTPMH